MDPLSGDQKWPLTWFCKPMGLSSHFKKHTHSPLPTHTISHTLQMDTYILPHIHISHKHTHIPPPPSPTHGRKQKRTKKIQQQVTIYSLCGDVVWTWFCKPLGLSCLPPELSSSSQWPPLLQFSPSSCPVKKKKNPKWNIWLFGFFSLIRKTSMRKKWRKRTTTQSLQLHSPYSKLI